ncbi:ABC transporter related protein [Ethanoligenens harbinense YUAN-3]|uniref:ABC transporter related protein n=1 Tax=Ethanoligenens harbinense (strain DSM 18485 / JCM 12961 / CGMCC 1.5033 / YUAN-3) TaxID=663278 RepID=E6U4Y6_ETHHY|nr:ABC transporter related protein [Ethanoligenens harbinense YUAN-3]
MAAIIEIEHLVKSYVIGDNVVHALNDVSLSVSEREFVAIVGPSGSGKSTLMNIIGCLDIATSGSYKLRGQEISLYTEDELSEFRNRMIGFIFQRFNLLNKLNAVENVELPLVYQGISSKERRERAVAALEKVRLANRMLHTPMELSGGQQQRVAIARALITDPPVILADEPTGNLDSTTGKEVMQILQGLGSAGHTIVLITHDMNIAKQARRIVRISDGRLVSDEEVSRS